MKTPKIDVGTKIRTAALFITALNQILVLSGISPIPFDEESVEIFVSSGLFGASAIWAWWKDNDFSRFARLNKKPKKKKIK